MIQNGTPVTFGFPTTSGGMTISGLSGVLLQTADLSADADHEDTRDNQGNIVARGWYDPHNKATLEWVVTGSSLAAAITNQALASLVPGTILSITACAGRPELVGTNWEVISAANRGSNTTSGRININVEKRAGITAAAS